MQTHICVAYDVRARAREMGLPDVEDLAMLPGGLDQAAEPIGLYHESEAATLRKFFAEQGLLMQELASSRELEIDVKKSADWIAPVIFVGSAIWSENEHVVSLAVDLLSSYISEFIAGVRPKIPVKLTFIVERTKQRDFKQVTFEGTVEGMKELRTILRQVADE